MDLFNHGYYWEAHEAWESLWHAAGRTGPVADFLKGLIKLAAAGVKVAEGNQDGARSHAKRAAELFRACESLGEQVMGLDRGALARAAEMSVTGEMEIELTPTVS
jgi:predicted metal-dependent hydrolase